MMSFKSKREYIKEIRDRYKRSSRSQKSQLLQDVSDITGYHRKYVTTLFNKPPPDSAERIYAPRAKKYDQIVIKALGTLWTAANEVCAERLHPFIPEFLERLISCGELIVRPETKKKLLAISLGTLKRCLSTIKPKASFKIGGTTKPGTLLKRQIAIRLGPWIDVDPGWCETDTVSHCGGDPSGTFISSLNIVDISSAWSEQAAIMGKGEKATVESVDGIRNRLPFPLLGLDPDNGSEFINWHLFRYCKSADINLTRSRPNEKNDNAHVEQKNYTAIRQLIGYLRFDTEEQLAILNDLYANEWRLYLNFFQPTMKLREKIKDPTTGKCKKKYYPAQTPYQRLMLHPKVSESTKVMLKSIYERLNPIQLQRQIKSKLNKLRDTLR